MGRIGTEVLIILLLLVANGVFAMSEIAVVSSRKTRLQQRAEAGDHGARKALELSEHPTRFLSTVQVGITLIGILAGAFGGATIAEQLAAVIARNATLAPYAEGIGLAVVVLAITYLSLIIGELVPKRIALNAPERIAAAVAAPMNTLSFLARPLVKVLTVSTELVLTLLRVKKTEEPPVTEQEITVLLEQGTQAGVFERAEQDIVERVFWLGDQRVAGLMTPRHRITRVEVDAPAEAYREKMLESPHSRFLVCEGGIDHVLLRADEGAFDQESASLLHLSLRKVQRIRQRFANATPPERLERALYDRPRPGSDPLLDLHGEVFLVALACSKPPPKREHWTMQLLADRLVELDIVEAISDETVRRTLKNKHAQALAEAAVVHPQRRRSVRGGDGGRPRPLR